MVDAVADDAASAADGDAANDADVAVAAALPAATAVAAAAADDAADAIGAAAAAVAFGFCCCYWPKINNGQPTEQLPKPTEESAKTSTAVGS